MDVLNLNLLIKYLIIAYEKRLLAEQLAFITKKIRIFYNLFIVLIVLRYVKLIVDILKY